ncbi:GGDEF domain-containing protein [Cellulomonas sp. HD19AZ1]|uniref:GGDEF domain-containing protein n=1 Tax=Cellulomonas sp. HD19AZ1 TaxID=2559593 RepID=UPI0010714407|nr:GGDEF domain-containing protein [Cellulomonas sp. HD19AZ1]TFH72854.1 GGDEF domain-containing protein [Cellulomonas sp. HD19AZ1]
MGLVDESMPRLHGGRGLLAVMFGVMAVIVLVALGWSVNPQASVVPWVTVAALLAALSGLTLVLPDRRWTQPALLATGMVGLGVLVACCRTAEGMISVSLGLITAAQLAAFAFPARQAVPLVGFALAVTTVGMGNAAAPFHPMSWVSVMVVTVASTSLLGYVTHWLRHHATTDDLTGALTRRTLFARVGVLLRHARRSGAPLALVSADVDDFKGVNDTRGHHAGDEVLASLVATWRSALRGSAAVIGRTGGDEFVVALPGYDEARASAWVERTRADSPAPWSAGIAVATPDDTVPDLLRRADAALYATKHARPGAPREQHPA